ncbi:hypothetical protein TNCV_4673311 [Trichonephila clavipes]|nr:hypothetical protein TNCV_4673311 [Trichonephila clavipes]
MTATVGSDVVQFGRPILMTFSNIWGRISEITRRLPSDQAFVAYPHGPMTLHSPTKNSLVVLNHKILEANKEVQNVKLGGHQTCLSKIDCGTSCVTCCAILLEPQLLDVMIVQLRNEKVSNLGSIPITIDCNVVAIIVFEEVRTNDSTSP